MLDVGCGTGALTVRLAELLGPERVVGADPDAEAVAKCGARVPGAQLHQARAESLPFLDASFDGVLAQLVVGLLNDPAAGAATSSPRASGRFSSWWRGDCRTARSPGPLSSRSRRSGPTRSGS
ncbi:MAG: class I SAM-dependent methyltransferase [Solirubrobacterales bacterium]|nr:class I SAM-dependent methyltransferase [Solirubrobacterales bacterium]